MSKNSLRDYKKKQIYSTIWRVIANYRHLQTKTFDCTIATVVILNLSTFKDHFLN